MITIFTKELVDSKLVKPDQAKSFLIEAKKTNQIIDTIIRIKSLTTTIEIRDITSGYKTGTTIEVRDHINKTGTNPLIGNQQKLEIDFPDLSTLYQSSSGVVTECLGNHFYKFKLKNSSTWLCHISIVARALGIKVISGNLISI